MIYEVLLTVSSVIATIATYIQYRTFTAIAQRTRALLALSRDRTATIPTFPKTRPKLTELSTDVITRLGLSFNVPTKRVMQRSFVLFFFCADELDRLSRSLPILFGDFHNRVDGYIYVVVLGGSIERQRRMSNSLVNKFGDRVLFCFGGESEELKEIMDVDETPRIFDVDVGGSLVRQGSVLIGDESAGHGLRGGG